MWRVKKGRVKVEESRTSWSSCHEDKETCTSCSTVWESESSGCRRESTFFFCINDAITIYIYMECLSIFQGKALVEINYRLSKNQSYLTGESNYNYYIIAVTAEFDIVMV